MTSYKESDEQHPGRSGDARGCLIPIITAAIVVATGVTLINWLVLDETPDEQAATAPGEDAPTAEKLAHSADALIDELSPGDGQAVSRTGLFEVARTVGWTDYGHPEVYDLQNAQRTVRKFRRDGAQIELTVHVQPSAEAAASLLERIEPPARAVQIGHHVVALNGLNAAGTDALPALEAVYRKYAELVADARD